MNHRSLWVLLVAFVVSLSPLAATFSGNAYADEAAAAEEELMTEAELADVLVEVLGLAAFLPPNPQQADVIGVLLQNEIVPKDGWNPTNYVTMGTLARILVQSMDAQSEIENPDDDGSWVAYLASIGIEFGTVDEGVAQLEPIDDPVAVVAVDPSTDPLRKVPSIRPSDEQQLGALLQGYNSQLSRADILQYILDTEPPVVEEPPKTTPN